MMVKRITEEDIIKAEKDRTRKMMKVLIPITAVVIILAVIAGIIANKMGNKSVITVDDFIVITHTNGYELFDVKEELENKDMFDRVLVAKKGDDNTVYFLIFKNAGDAKSFFAGTAKKYKAAASQAGVTEAIKTDYENYANYIVNANETYMHVARVRNTVVFSEVPEKHQPDIEKLIEEINY